MTMYFIFFCGTNPSLDIYLPIQDVWTAVNCKISFGLFSLLSPVRAEINTVGYEVDTPMSNSKNIVATAATTLKYSNKI